MKGKVKFFNEVKGFGFIIGDDGKEYFVHQTGVKDGAVITDNDQVEFEVQQGDRGPKAANVVKSGGGSDAGAAEDSQPEAADDTEPEGGDSSEESEDDDR